MLPGLPSGFGALWFPGYAGGSGFGLGFRVQDSFMF